MGKGREPVAARMHPCPLLATAFARCCEILCHFEGVGENYFPHAVVVSRLVSTLSERPQDSHSRPMGWPMGMGVGAGDTMLTHRFSNLVPGLRRHGAGPHRIRWPARRQCAVGAEALVVLFLNTRVEGFPHRGSAVGQPLNQAPPPNPLRFCCPPPLLFPQRTLSLSN